MQFSGHRVVHWSANKNVCVCFFCDAQAFVETIMVMRKEEKQILQILRGALEVPIETTYDFIVGRSRRDMRGIPSGAQ